VPPFAQAQAGAVQPPPVTLTDEQKARIERNRQEALVKRAQSLEQQKEGGSASIDAAGGASIDAAGGDCRGFDEATCSKAVDGPLPLDWGEIVPLVPSATAETAPNPKKRKVS
jgi:hypothetical protein